MFYGNVKNSLKWHGTTQHSSVQYSTSRTTGIYVHLIVYILCTPTYLFSSIFINIYYENKDTASQPTNRMGLRC